MGQSADNKTSIVVAAKKTVNVELHLVPDLKAM
jgi:hypothetical protein